MNNIQTTDLHPRLLWFAILAYSMINLLAHWFVIFTISLAGLSLNAGLFIYPISFLLSGLITEIYGYKQARRAALCGLLFNVLFILYGQFIVYLPSPSYSISNRLFDSLINIYLQGIILSTTSYFMIEPLNLFCIAKSKICMSKYPMKLRFFFVTNVSTMTSVSIFNLLKPHPLVFSIKLLSTILIIETTILTGSSITSYLAKKIKNIEKIDIYDNRTRFKIFRLETNYSADDNRFNRKNNE